jgi:DNA-binding NarL/FixJ family response regulator
VTVVRPATTEPRSILLAEDETLVRQGVKLMIHTAPDLRVTGEAANGREAVELHAMRAFDLVILDVRMPEMDGVTAAQRILGRQPEQKILFLTTFNDDESALKALRLGVRGYLLKSADADRLIASIRSVLDGGLPLEDHVAAKVVPRLLRGSGAASTREGDVPVAAGGGASPTGSFQADGGGTLGEGPSGTEALTGRELSVTRLVGQGRSNAEIADDLGITQGTVKNVVSAVLDKLGLRDRTQLAIYAIRRDLA